MKSYAPYQSLTLPVTFSDLIHVTTVTHHIFGRPYSFWNWQNGVFKFSAKVIVRKAVVPC